MPSKTPEARVSACPKGARCPCGGQRAVWTVETTTRVRALQKRSGEVRQLKSTLFLRGVQIKDTTVPVEVGETRVQKLLARKLPNGVANTIRSKMSATSST